MPKRVPPLSAIAVSKLKPNPDRTIELVDGAVPGLRMRLSPNGTRSWSLNVRAKGVMRRFEVGTGLGLSDARKTAEALRLSIREGADPTASRRAERNQAIAAKQGIGTLGSVISVYFETGPGAGLKTGNEQRKRIEAVFAKHLCLVAKEVKPEDLQLTIDRHKAKASSARAASYFSPVSKWAAKRGYLLGRFDLEKPVLGAPKQRVLEEAELAKLWPNLTGPYGLCCRLILMTGTRRDEARYATWGQFDLEAKTWTIPGDQRKDTRTQGRRRQRQKEAFVIPLSNQMVDLMQDARTLEEERRIRMKIADPISDDDCVFFGTQGGKLERWTRWLHTQFEETGVKDWSPHALRRTAATIVGELGFAPHIVSVLLGHSNIGGYLVAGYNKSRYSREHVEALQSLADKLDAIATRAKSDAVRHDEAEIEPMLDLAFV